MEQEPGPRGSPQLPQAPDGMGVADDEPLVWTANTDNRDAKSLPPHIGQEDFCFPSTMASKAWLQALQVYSNIGIRRFQITPKVNTCT